MEGTGSVPGQDTKIPHAIRHSQNKQKIADMERYFQMMSDLSSQPSSSGPPDPPTNCEQRDEEN